MFDHLLVILYSTTQLVALIAYIPQIILYLKSKSSRSSISISTWLLWSVTSIIAFLYSYLEVEDMYIATAQLSAAIMNTAVLIMGIQYRLTKSVEKANIQTEDLVDDY